MAEDIAQWLNKLGLGHYAQAFADNDIGLDVLSDLSDADLRELGVSLGDRKRLLRAVSDRLRGSVLLESEVVSPIAPITPDAERRQLTVLFCDLVGSTELSVKLDPEDMREVLLGYQEACSKVITRYDGYVAKFMGDGVYAYFGYPTAHEDDAERAITAGLGIVESVAGLEHDLAVRIGIATGNVAVGDLIGEGASEEANVVGEAPNLAARLQALADPNTVLIGEATHRLAGGMFETSNLGAQELKGFTNPVGAWRVLRASTNESRFQATRGEHLTDLIGREEELDTLLRRWQRSQAGEGQVVLISGEPGIGKSRLAQALQDKIIGEPHTLLRYQCSPYHTNSALYPIIEQFERVAEFEPGDSPNVKLDKLEAVLAQSGKPVKDTAPFIASMLSISTGDRYPTINVSPQRQKELTLKVLVDQLTGLAEQQPVFFVFEDAHWIDPTTREFLELKVERVPDAAVLMLITYRPEFDAPWVGRARVTPMILSRLERRDCALMVENVARDFGIAEELRDRIATQTDGVPLFIEELTKSVLETTTDSGANIEVPTTLQDSLEARLDRLGTAKEVAEVGAVIGRTFDYDLLSRVMSMDVLALASALEALVDSGLVTARGTSPNSTFTFKHALVQDTAYASLLRARRSELHGRIAGALNEKFPEIGFSEPELLAHHFTEAGQTEIAIEYWKRAGENCWERPAITEAIEHFKRGIELTQSLPESEKRSRLELDLQTLLAPILQGVHGWGAPEPIASYARAQELARELNDTEKLFPILWGYWTINRGQQKPVEARKIVDELFVVAQERNDPLMYLQAHHAAWGQPFQGRIATQMEHIEKALKIYDPALHSLSATTYGNHDVGVCALFHKSIILWSMGFPVQSRQNREHAVNLANKIPHLPTRVQIQHMLNWINYFNGDARAVHETASKAIEDSREIGLFNFLPMSIALRGWADSLGNDPNKGVSDIHQGIETLLSKSSTGAVATSMYLLAEGIANSTAWEEAVPALEAAIEKMNQYSERLMVPNAFALMGDVLLRQSPRDHETPENWYRKAIDYARDQKTKMWELRATTRLARLWYSQGRTKEARDLLAPMYGWFTEGFDTTDLIEAKALLDQLG